MVPTAVRFNPTGFNRSYAGKNATAYGRGCYFARDSEYSNKYASRDSKDERRILLAWVLVGMYCQGNPSMCAPTEGCQSTVNRIPRPHIFVTYNDTQSYPAYEIVYRTT
jgi:poly [ADP-ribose] polymerase 10/14/15